jgi:hypothetical protein
MQCQGAWHWHVTWGVSGHVTETLVYALSRGQILAWLKLIGPSSFSFLVPPWSLTDVETVQCWKTCKGIKAVETPAGWRDVGLEMLDVPPKAQPYPRWTCAKCGVQLNDSNDTGLVLSGPNIGVCRPCWGAKTWSRILHDDPYDDSV